LQATAHAASHSTALLRRPAMSDTASARTPQQAGEESNRLARRPQSIIDAMKVAGFSQNSRISRK